MMLCGFKMGSSFCHHLQSTEGEIKTAVQCTGNPKGTGGWIIYDNRSFPVNNQCLVPDPGHKALIRGSSSVRPFGTVKKDKEK